MLGLGPAGNDTYGRAALLFTSLLSKRYSIDVYDQVALLNNRHLPVFSCGVPIGMFLPRSGSTDMARGDPCPPYSHIVDALHGTEVEGGRRDGGESAHRGQARNVGTYSIGMEEDGGAIRHPQPSSGCTTDDHTVCTTTTSYSRAAYG